ncbi:MAG: hypothetical protein AXA67_00015 [Methylothermaceae bacteria B42]|nr:MAG: hypothetical protein AXA67_00015 [Methylothermaceae bacteria B42]
MQRVLLLVVIFVVSVNLLADDDASAQQPTISLDVAVNKVRGQYADGKIVKTDEEESGSGKVYVIKMITADNRVLHIRVNAQSGEIVD